MYWFVFDFCLDQRIDIKQRVQQLHYIMSVNRSIVLLFIVCVSLSFNIDSDSYLNFNRQGYTFTFENSKSPVILNITGLPQGLSLQNYTISPVGGVKPGQYILSVKAEDASNNKDQKILILNVDSSLANPNPNPNPTPQAQSNLGQQSSSIQLVKAKQITPAEPIATKTIVAQSDNSSISSFFQSSSFGSDNSFGNGNSFGSASQVSNSLANVDSLQNFFNQVQVPQNNQNGGINLISNNLNDILSGFSNASSSQSYSQTINVSVTPKTLVSKSIDLNFNDSQKSTVSTDEANALFLKQKLASQYVAANYSIVLQLTANKNMLNGLIANLTKQYQVDDEIHKSMEIKVKAASENKSKIESAISNINNYLGTLKQQITDSNSRMSQIQGQRQVLQSQRNLTSANLQQVNQTIQSLQAQIQSAFGSLGGNSKTCQSFSSSLLQANKTLNINSIQLSQVSQQLESANNDIVNKQAIVDDLARQLALAQQALQQARNNSFQLSTQKSQLQITISSVKENITKINQNLNSCNVQTASSRQIIQNLQSSLRARQALLAQYSNENNTQSSQLSNIQGQLAQETANYNNLINQSNNAQSALSKLQSALPEATSILQNVVNLHAQAALNVQNVEATLSSAIERFKSETANLQMANMNLQNARALSREADKLVNSMLAERGNALPYAVGVNNINTALLGQTIINSQINISNWFNYLTANFGSAAFPYQSAQVSCLYAFNLSNLRNDIPCPSDGQPLRSFTGKIISINSFNEIVVTMDGTNANQTVQIPNCAELTSNIKGYKLTVGDCLIAKGVSQQDNTTIAKNIVFLRK